MNNNIHTEEIELTDAQLEAICGGVTSITGGSLAVPDTNSWVFSHVGGQVILAAGGPAAANVSGTVVL